MPIGKFFLAHESLESKPLDGGETLHIVKFEDHHAEPPHEVFQLCCVGEGGSFRIPLPENAHRYKLGEIVEMYQTIRTREDVVEALRKTQEECRQYPDK